MSDTRALAAILVLALVAFGSWWLSRGGAPFTAPADPRARHDPDYAIEHFTATAMNERGRKRYVLTANRLVHYPDNDTAYLEQPYLIQYPDTGAPIHARAETAMIPGDADEIYLRGNVRVTRGADARSVGGAITSDDMRIELDR